MAFFSFRSSRNKLITQEAITQALDCIPSDSDISGVDDDSDLDDTFLPEEETVPSSAEESEDEAEDLPDLGDQSADARDLQEGVDNDDDVPDDVQVAPRAAKNAPKRRRVSGAASRQKPAVRDWVRRDLPPEELPESFFRARNIQDCQEDIDFFMKLFGEENFVLLTEQTNLVRAKRMIDNNRPIPGISEDEIRQTIGILMYMSVVSLPNIQLYWRESLRIDMVASVMSRDRFRTIVSCMHLSDNTQEPARDSAEYDRLYKVRKFLNNLHSNFQEHAYVEDVCSVDEQTIPFKGHLGLKVYNKDKPAKWGIKVYCLAGKSGYIHSFYVSGDNRSTQGMSPDDIQKLDGLGASGQVVVQLLLMGEAPPGVHVFFDNYFASPAALIKLKDLGYPAACTVRKDRVDKCPLKGEKELRQEGRGSVDFYTCEEGILVAKWYDNKEVTVASNHYSVHPMDQVRRWDKKKKEYIIVRRPNLIAAYNKGMGGVDRCDQLLAFYRLKTKSPKWYRRFLYHFTDLATINAFIMRREHLKTPKMPLFEFKLEVARALMFSGRLPDPMAVVAAVLDNDDEDGDGDNARKSKHGDPKGGPIPTDDVRYDGKDHWPENAAKRARRCRLSGCKGMSCIWCSKCKVYLCVKKDSNCFMFFHTM